MSTPSENRHPPLRLLLVEDSSSDAQLFLDMLEDGGDTRVDVTWVQTLAAARLALSEPLDCVLLDVGLPDARGLEGLLALRGQSPDTPVVVVTGHEDRDFALEAVAAGAQDYLIKGSSDVDALLRAAHYAIERQRAQGLLARRALQDPLTGLGNRTMLLDRLELALNRRRRAESPAALLFLDLDGFKAINDTHGHAAGDAVLLAVGRALRDALRTEDTVARFGGDEFAALCEDVPDADAAAVVATRVVEGVRGIRCGEQIVSVSLGIALSDPAVTPEQLLASADEAMYAAKRAGKDRWVLHAPVAGAR